MGEYADWYINDHIDKGTGVPTYPVSSKSKSNLSFFKMKDSKIGEITSKGEALIKKESWINTGIATKIIKSTDKAVLFESEEEDSRGKMFWLPKSLFMSLDGDLPQSKVIYIPDWSDIKFINE